MRGTVAALGTGLVGIAVGFREVWSVAGLVGKYGWALATHCLEI